MTTYEVMTYIEKVKKGDYVFSREGLEKMSEGEYRDLSVLMYDGKYIRSKDDIVPIFNHSDPVCGNIIGIYGVNMGIAGFQQVEGKIPELYVTEMGDRLYKSYLKEQENAMKLKEVNVDRGSTYIGGNVERSEVVSKFSLWKWTKSNKLTIGSIALNIVLLVKVFIIGV